MQILSALDAVSPAFSRTRLVLFSPFRWGRTWKFSATAYCARVGTMFIPFPLLYLVFLPSLRAQFGAVGVWGIVAAVVVATLLFLWIFALCSKIAFPFFDIVLLREQFVAPSWRRHGAAARKWTSFKVAVGTVLTAAMAGPLAHYMQRVFQLIALVSVKPGQPPPADAMHQMMTFYASFFVVYFAIIVFYFLLTLTADFVLPSLALENTTLAEAFRRFGRLIAAEPVQLALYAIVKLGLGLAMYVGGFIALEIALIILELVVGLGAVLVGLILHLLHVPTIVIIVLAVIVGVAFLAFVFYAIMIAMGAFFTFFEAYNLYFLGGRYPMLGDLLEQSTPPVSVATQLPPGPPYSYPPPNIPAQ